jgi:hypothetical protein
MERHANERALLSQLVTALVGFRPGSENHRRALEFMFDNAVLNNRYLDPSPGRLREVAAACVFAR